MFFKELHKTVDCLIEENTKISTSIYVFQIYTLLLNIIVTIIFNDPHHSSQESNLHTNMSLVSKL